MSHGAGGSRVGRAWWGLTCLTWGAVSGEMEARGVGREAGEGVH